MSQTWTEDLESEDYESNGEADYQDFGQDARPDARRARQQRMMLERQRMMLDRRRRETELRRRRARPLPRGAPPSAAGAAGPGPRQTLEAIQSLDLDTKVELDSLHRQLEESNRRAGRGIWAAVAGIATAEIINQFDALGNHPNMSAAIIAAPLLLLSPQKHRSGIEGFLLDPRVIGGAAVLGIVAASRFTSTSKAVHGIQIFGIPQGLTAPAAAKPALTGTLTAVATDKSGNPLSGTQFTWTANPTDQLTITAGAGANSQNATWTLAPAATANPAQETVVITAQAEGKTQLASVTLNAPG
jgi:hypothetical protein